MLVYKFAAVYGTGNVKCVASVHSTKNAALVAAKELSKKIHKEDYQNISLRDSTHVICIDRS